FPYTTLFRSQVDVLRGAQPVRGAEARAREPQSCSKARRPRARPGPVDLAACLTDGLEVTRCTRNLGRPALQQGQQALGRDLGQGCTYASVIVVQHIDATTLAERGSQMRPSATEIHLEIENGRHPLARHPQLGVVTG